MKLKFIGDVTELKPGMEVLSGLLGFSISGLGLEVHVERTSENHIKVSKSADKIKIFYKEKIHFFRALGLLIEALREKEEFEIIEEPQFTLNGPMIDVSQGNAVIQVRNVKRILEKMAVMGLNMIMLYSEDSYEMKDEPYFGYLRSKYTHEELKDIDDFAAMLGIEVIPCIQTLAHLIDALKWDCYQDMRQEDDVLLVGYERTYEFIEKLIRQASAPFRTKRIHIGMDEAWRLGQGRYLDINGYREKFDIMNEHLERVLEITKSLGLIPMIWSDMYFGGGYKDSEWDMPQEKAKKMPKDLQYIFWDYYNNDEKFYTDLIRQHKKFTSNILFAGGIWNWMSFTLNYGKTFSSTNASLNACKREGVKEILATIWGDDTTECPIFSTMLGLQLFAEHGYAKNLDMDKLKKRFEFCTGAKFDDFMDLKLIDEVPGTEGGNTGRYPANSSKLLMWQDILLGLFDKNFEGHEVSKHYDQLVIRMHEAKTRNGEFNFLFEFYEKVCSTLALKSEMGLMLTKAYRNRDLNFLNEAVNIKLPELYRRAADLRVCNRSLWMETYKPIGWEIMELRYGLLLMRIDTAISRIKDYLDGKIENIEELEQERLYFSGDTGIPQCYIYNKLPSACRISTTTSYNLW